MRSMLATESSAKGGIRSVVCDGTSHMAHPRCGFGGKAGAKAWHCGRTQGCRWCSKSACERLVNLSSSRLAWRHQHGKTGPPRRRWIMQVAPWAHATVDANGLAVQPQEQADLVPKLQLWTVGRACQIEFGGVNNAPVVPSPTSVVRSARTLPLAPTTAPSLARL